MVRHLAGTTLAAALALILAPPAHAQDCGGYGSYVAGGQYGSPQQAYNAGYANGYAPQYGYAAPDGTTQSFYPPGGNAQSLGNSAQIPVRLPANAQLWVDDQQSPLTGPNRILVTPPLEQGKTYSYTLKAQWDDNGRPVTQERKVSFQAGRSATVDFNQPAPRAMPEPTATPVAPAPAAPPPPATSAPAAPPPPPAAPPG
jgi:uncharacterized protein (TIGR03000 family)